MIGPPSQHHFDVCARICGGAIAALLVALLAGCSTAGDLRAAPREAIVEGGGSATLRTRQCVNYFLLEATINDKGPFTLLIDTGANQTVLSPKAADRLADDARPAAAYATGSQGRTQRISSFVRVRSLRAGPLELRDFDAVTIELTRVQAALGTRLDGILGYPAFSRLLLTLDYPARQVRVSPGELPDEDGKLIIPLTSWDRPNVEAVMAGRRRIFLLDSGKSGGVSVTRFDDFPFESPPADVSTGVAVGGGFVRRMGRLNGDIDIGAIRLRRPVIENSDSSNLIGAEAMDGFAVTFDQQNQRVRFEPAAGTVVQFPPVRGIGVGFGYEDNAWTVSHVFDGTPAQLAGLVEGDRVVRVGGRRLSDLSCRRTSDLFQGEETLQLDVVRSRKWMRFDVPVMIVVP